MPGIPPKPPRPNGDCAGSGAGAPLLPLITEFFSCLLLINYHLVGGAGAGVGDGAAGAAAAAPPCFITRWTVIPS